MELLVLDPPKRTQTINLDVNEMRFRQDNSLLKRYLQRNAHDGTRGNDGNGNADEKTGTQTTGKRGNGNDEDDGSHAED